MLWFVIIQLLFTSVLGDYWDDRIKFIAQDGAYAVGAGLELNAHEQEISNVLMQFKIREFDEGFANPGNFSPARHFFHAREAIEKSEVFRIIKTLPKGASLHTHDTASVSSSFLHNLTYLTDLYACKVEGKLQMHFFKQPVTDTTCPWRLLSDLRTEDPTYDSWLKTQLTLEVPDPKEAYPDINTVWKKFMGLFSTVHPLVTYKPIFAEYFYQVLQEFYDDNVMYLEFRGTLPELYDLDGNVYGPVETAGLYKQTLEKFKRSHPNFVGAKLIYSPIRHTDNKTMEEYIALAKTLKQTYPRFVAGFDLVGQEDLGQPLEMFINELTMVSKEMKVYFHAGETNWYGSTSDMNLVDAILLGTTRIGHGFSMVKHPQVMRAVKQKGIGIEISPISNQVLMLVDDIRNHPGNILIANGMPVVICNDDPSFWGAKALSYDWYMAFMGMTGRDMDLRFLKQIAINSYLYSGMSSKEKVKAFSMWEHDWQVFVRKIRKRYSNEIAYD